MTREINVKDQVEQGSCKQIYDMLAHHTWGLGLDAKELSSQVSQIAGGDPNAVGCLVRVLMEAMDDEPRKTSAALLMYFSKTDAMLALDTLIDIVNDSCEPKMLVNSCLGILGRFGPDSAMSVPALIGLLDRDDDEEDAHNRHLAVCVLANIGLAATPATSAVLSLASSDSDIMVREMATCALYFIAPEALNKDAYQEPWQHILVDGLVQLYALGNPREALDLLKHLESTNLAVRSGACWLILCLANTDIIEQYEPVLAPALLKRFVDSDAHISSNAASALELIVDRDNMGWFGTPQLETIEKALHCANPEVVSTSLRILSWSLGQRDAIRDESSRVIPTINRLLDHNDANVRNFAVITLGSFGPLAAVARDGLENALKDKDEYVRKHAKEVLEVLSKHS